MNTRYGKRPGSQSSGKKQDGVDYSDVLVRVHDLFQIRKQCQKYVHKQTVKTRGIEPDQTTPPNAYQILTANVEMLLHMFNRLLRIFIQSHHYTLRPPLSPSVVPCRAVPAVPFSPPLL